MITLGKVRKRAKTLLSFLRNTFFLMFLTSTNFGKTRGLSWSLRNAFGTRSRSVVLWPLLRAGLSTWQSCRHRLHLSVVRMQRGDFSPDDDSEDGSPPRASTRVTTHASPVGPSMPASLTNVASLVQSNDSKEWRIRAGDDLPKFLVANGPGRITSYNFKVLQESTWLDRAVRIGSGDKKHYF